tara:strand:+ start:207 stop:848 length:642 start_codon:yes stop_codon:yes gene_type:complete
VPKKLSKEEKNEIIKLFINGEKILDISEKFNFSKITITRHLKKNFSDEEFNKIKKNIQRKELDVDISNQLNSNNTDIEKDSEELNFKKSLLDPSFIEITPLDYEIDNVPQKDLSSIPLTEVKLPKIAYMIVDNKIELQTKLLRDYPEWKFLSEDELNRNTIEIFSDIKIAKKFCTKGQKIIKVPNTDVFRITSPILLSRGISRIISAENLISL